MSSISELSNKYVAGNVNELMDNLNVQHKSGNYVVGNQSFKDFEKALNYADMKLDGFSDQDALKKLDELLDQEGLDALVTKMPILTLDYFPGREIEKVCGSARGGTVRAKHFGKDFAAGFKNIVGGEIKGYTELMAEGREEALYRMKVDADKMGADAVIGYRFSSSMIAAGVTEMLAYGTAVKLSEIT